MDERKFPWFTSLLVICALLGLIGWSQKSGTPETMVPVALFLSFPVVFSLSFYRLRYSLLGNQRRTAPEGSTLESRKWSSVVFSAWYWRANSLARLSYHPDGIGLSIFLAGKGFLHLDEIEKAEAGFGQMYRLEHRSPALRSPLYIPLSEGLVEKLFPEGQQESQTSLFSKINFKKLGFQLLLILTMFPFLVFFATKETAHAGFTLEEGRAWLIQSGVVEEGHILDLKTGEKKRVYRYFAGLPFRHSEGYGGAKDWLRSIRDPRTGVSEIRLGGRTLAHGRPARLSRDGSRLAYRAHNRTLVVRKVPSGELVLSRGSNPGSLRWAPETNRLLVHFPLAKSGKHLVFGEDGKLLWRHQGRWADWGPKPSQLSVLSKDGSQLRVFELGSDEAVANHDVKGWTRFQWSPDGKSLLFSKANALFLADSSLRNERKLLRLGTRSSYQWSPDGEFFVVSSSWRARFAYFDRAGKLVKDFGLGVSQKD